MWLYVRLDVRRFWGLGGLGETERSVLGTLNDAHLAFVRVPALGFAW